ncbi:MAG: Fe-S cluster assembly protein SufD [Vicinamibacterales bacterium]
MSSVAERHEPYVAASTHFAESRGRSAPMWLQQLRAQASSKFAEQGFPTVREEAWRFTNVSPIAEGDFAIADGAPRDASAVVSRVAVSDALRVTLVNGRLAPELSALGSLPKGLHVSGLHDAIVRNESVIREHLATFKLEPHPFAALNTSFLDEGVVVVAEPGTIVETPIQIVSVTSADGKPLVSFPRTLVVAGARSQLRLAQTFVGDEDAAYFSNAVIEVAVHQGAVVDFSTDQRESSRAFHVLNLQAHLGAGAVFGSHAFALGSRLMRHDISVTLGGEGADATMNGVYLVDGTRLMDTHTSLDHAMPHCTSHQIYKGILAGKARGVFNGRIVVRPDAQKTDAKQTNRALLLSDEAQINSNPQLEIFADDVKCTHGAAVGQLDAEAMFYLQARGLTPAEARDMMLHAFAGEVLEGLKIPELRAQIESALFETLARDLAGQR